MIEFWESSISLGRDNEAASSGVQMGYSGQGGTRAKWPMQSRPQFSSLGYEKYVLPDRGT